MSLLLAVLMVLEVFSPVAVSAKSLLDEEESHNSIMSEPRMDSKSILGPETKPKKAPGDDELFSVPAKKAELNKETNKIQEAPARQKESSTIIESPAKEETAPQKELDNKIIEAGRQREQKAEDKLNQAVERARQAEKNAKASENLNLETTEIEKPGYKAWRVVNRIKAIYKDGKLDCQGLLIEVEDFKGNKKTLTYDDILKDKNIIVNKEIKEGLFGSSELIITTPGLRDIKIDVKVENMKKDKNEKSELSLNKDNSNKLEDKENTEEKEEKEGLLDKLKETLGLTGLQKADKELKKALADEKNGLEEIQALLNTFEEKYELSREDQRKLMSDNTDALKEFVEKHGYKNFDPQMFMIFNDDKADNDGLEISGLEDKPREDRELTIEELEAGLAKVELPTENAEEKEEGTGFFSFFRSPVRGPQPNGLELDGKKFHVRTIFQTSTINGPILVGQYFNIHLDEQLTVKDTKTLQPIKNKAGEIIAQPEYDSANNIIKYKIVKEIKENLNIPLDISVDYNKEKIKADKDGNFIVTNKVSGLGVTNPKDLIPTMVNKYGNVINQIIEPGRKDVTQIIEADNQAYKVNLDGWSTPHIEDKQLKGYYWTFTITSDKDLESLGYKANFTTVKGSGLGEIKDIKMNGKAVTEDQIKDQLNGNFGIVDSKHHNLTDKGVEKIVYTFYTETTDVQASYMVDFSIALTNTAQKRVGAKRFIVNEAYNLNKIEEATPNRVGMNNRTTILGEFTSEDATKWTVTDAISSGDENPSLPLEDRILGGNQSQTGGQVAVYKLNANGEMVQDGTTQTNVNPIPGKGKNPGANQPVGTIAVYEYTGSIDTNNKGSQSLGGVTISKYQDLYVNQEWSLAPGTNMPGQTIWAKDENGTEIGKVTLQADTDQNNNSRRFTIPDVKVWSINNDGNGNITATKSVPKVVQDLPKTVGDTKYYENTNYFGKSDVKEYFIHNRATKDVNEKLTTFSIVKIDKNPNKDGSEKKLPGATFKLLGAQTGTDENLVTTDSNGKATFSNVLPGSYTLVETNAPAGYKIGDDLQVTVDSQGNISIGQSSNATLAGGRASTGYSEDQNYPGYMNASYYGTIDEKGNTTAYIYLKPNSGDTNRDTRISLVPTGGTISTVEMFDVDPESQRETIKQAMENQTVDTNISSPGSNVINANHWDIIKGKENIKDDFTGKTGYQIKIPKERMTKDWGFLIKVKGKKDSNSSAAGLSFDWLSDGDNTFVKNNAKIQTSVNLAGKDDSSESVITITNEAFQTKPVQVDKIDQNKYKLQGARFKIMDEKKEVIKTVSTDSEGRAIFGEMPEGKYIIEEESAPDGYLKSQVVFDVTVDSSNQVSYKARFKDDNGTPVNGYDYIIENEETTQNPSNTIVTKVNVNKLEIWENEPGDIGIRPGVWEAYRYESLKYNADITLANVEPGKKVTIQFDQNLDFTQYVNDMPKAYDKGVVVAEPYFDYNTNTLTYVFNDNVTKSFANLKLEIKGIIPSKFYAQNNGTYYFTNVVEPGKTGIEGYQSSEAAIPSNYETYDSSFSTPAQSYYFRDVYQVGDDWYVTAIAYYNPLVDRHKGARTLRFNWASTKRRNDLNIARWPIEGEDPAFKLQDVKVYRVLPSVYNGKLTNEHNMPLSFGIRPDQDPGTYSMVYSRKIDPESRIDSDRQGNITLEYDPKQIKSSGTINSYSPLRLRMPAISGQDEGYVIEQTFKVTDMPKWKRLWRTFYMTNGDLESAFTTKVNENTAIADQTGKEIPKFYTQKIKLINRKYTPGNFYITKRNDADRNTLLKGAQFSLTDDNDRTIYRTTGTDGKINFTNLRPGNYRLEEVTPPTGFSKVDSIWQINVNSQGVVTITETGLNATGESIVGNNINIDITNKPTGTDFNVYKKDDQNQPLEGAKFTLTKQGKGETFVATGTSDGNGKVTFSPALEKGIYILEEAEAPAGYKNLDKKWVVEVTTENGKNKAKVYNYVEGTKPGTSQQVNQSLLGDDTGTKWVDVAHRPLTGWDIYDNRWGGYVYNRRDPHKMGTRIIGINKDKKYVIQRYIINPEKAAMDLDSAIIHREKPSYDNMKWYAGTEDIKAFILTDGPAVGNIEDLRLGSYSLQTLEINTGKNDITTGSIQYSGNQNRMTLKFSDSVKQAVKAGKPLVIDVKVPYNAGTGGVGTGMDLTANNTVYWKSDYYETVDIIPEGDLVKKDGDNQEVDIKGGYISEDSLDVSNTTKRYNFRVQKVKEKKNDQDTADAISGATFKLQGPKPSRTEKWEKSDKEGYVNFKDLTPGVYTLTETGPALGYENQDTTWTVTVTKDGKIYFRENNSGGTSPSVDPEKQWQKLSANQPNRQSSNLPSKVASKITEVNKETGRFKQVFLVNNQPENLGGSHIEIHAQPENRGLNLENTKILSIKEVPFRSNIDNLPTNGNEIKYDAEVIQKKGYNRLKITPTNIPNGANKTFAVTVESYLPVSGGVGTGLDFINKYNGANNTYWGSEWYNSLGDINLEPLPEATGGKERSYYLAQSTNTPVAYRAANLGNKFENQGETPIPLKSEKDQMVEALDKNLQSVYGHGVNAQDLERSLDLRAAGMSAYMSFDKINGVKEDDGLELSEERVPESQRGAGDTLEQIDNYTVDSSNAKITVNANAVDTTDGTRTINVSVAPKDSGNAGQTGKNLQYVFMIDRSRDIATNSRTADAPTIDKNINKFLSDLAEKAKDNNTNVDVTFIEYFTNGAKVLGNYNQNLIDLYNSANSFTYNMKTNGFNDRNNVTAKDILGKVGISARPTDRNSTGDGSQVLFGNINNYYNQIVGNGKKYDKKYVLNIANFDAEKATYFLENPNNPYSTKKYYAAENNWIFRDTTKPAQDRFESYVLHISQKAGQTQYETYMSTNSGTLRFEKDTTYTNNGIYTYKNFLKSNLIKNEDFQSSGQVDQFLIKDASINIGLNQDVQLKGNPSANYGNINTTTNGFTLNNINLKKDQTLNLSYTINLKNTASDNTDYTIHNSMVYKPDGQNSVNLDTSPGMITRKNVAGPTKYTVSFVPNGGSGSMASTQVAENDYYTLPANGFTPPSGKEFKGWDVDGVTKQPNDSIQVTKDIEIKPIWGDTGPEQVTITFDNGGGSGSMNPVTVDKGTNYQLPEPEGLTPPDDKVFDKWKVGEATYNPGESITINGPTTVTATWKDKPLLTVTIESGQGSGNTVEASVKQGESYKLKDPSEYSFTAPTGDWVFDSWSIGDQNKQPGDSFTVNENTRVVALWKKSSTQQDGFKVTFASMSNGSVTAEPKEGLNEGDTVTLTVKPDKGYVLENLTVDGQDVTAKVNDYDKYTFQMPKRDVKVSATFQVFKDPLDNFTPEEGKDILVNGDKPVLPQIKNKQVGIELKLLKKNREGLGLKDAEFKLSKTDETYQNPDQSFIVTATSDENGNVVFLDPNTKKPIKLQAGYYTVEETKSPQGYKKAADVWKIHVKNDGGKMSAEYFAPKETPGKFVNSNDSYGDSTINTNNNIKYKSKITHIDPDAKTFVQRIYIDMRGYGGKEKVNLQITPKHKREETDYAPEADGTVIPPETNVEGLKTAYRTTYKINSPKADMTENDVNDVLKYYDLSKSNVEMVNTARWRPFGWGFDEDILNLEPGGVYFIDIEGYYDDALITGKATKEIDPNTKQPKEPYERTDIKPEDLKKLEMDFKFYNGEREFQQAVYNEKTKQIEWKRVDHPKGNFLNGNLALNEYYKANNITGPDGKIKQVSILSREGGRIATVPKQGKDSVVGFDNINPNAEIHTAADISSLYTVTEGENANAKEIPKTGLDLINEEEVYNITFSKHGRDGTGKDWADNSKNITDNRLEGAIFKLQKRIGNSNDYEDVQGSFVSSAFNGYFGFRGLGPGRYRLMEVKAPKGYRPIDEPILYMTIAYEKGKISEETGEIANGRGVITLEYGENNSIVRYSGANAEGTGKLVDYVTAATAKNMGKIINEKPGKGKVEITKLDEKGQLLPGAKFKLTRLTSKEAIEPGDNEKPDGIYTGTVGEDGKLLFELLPIGQYILQEIETVPGHQITDQTWQFTVGGKGLDPYADDNSSGGSDITDKLEIEKSEVKVLRPNEEESTNNKEIKPHIGENLQIFTDFKIKEGTKIRPGDYFTLKLSDNIDLEGVKRGSDDNFDLFADGIGTVAKAKYNKEAGTITYTFTKYAAQYTLEDFSNVLAANITLDKVKKSGTQKIGVGLGEDTSHYQDIAVNYNLDTTWLVYYDRALGMASKIVSFNVKTGEFVHYIYVNRDRTYFDYDTYFNYVPNVAVNDLKFEFFHIENANNTYDAMPASFGVDETDYRLRKSPTVKTFTKVEANSYNTQNLGTFHFNKSMIVKVTGKVDTDGFKHYKATSYLSDLTALNNKYDENKAGLYMYRWDQIYSFPHTVAGEGKLEISAVNPTNKVRFKKMDESGNALNGAEFYLVKWDETVTQEDKWRKVDGSDRTTGTDGLISYEELSPGKYALVEKRAPEGYKKIEGYIGEFEVDKLGKIYRQVEKKPQTQAQPGATENGGNLVSSAVNKVKAAATNLADNLTGNTTELIELKGETIDIINYKDIKFLKVDGDDTSKKLANAKFELYYKEKVTDEYKKLEDYKEEIKSDKDGNFSLSISRDGYYALKEIKAPAGYTPIPGYIKEFKLEGNKIQVKEKDPLKGSLTKGEKGMLTSEIIKVDKEKGTFTQRIILNPNHTTWKFDAPGTYLRFLENGWKITPEGMVASQKGPLVKAATLEKGKTPDSLEAKDFKDVVPLNAFNIGNATVRRYPVRSLFGQPNASGMIETNKAIVVEMTGELTDKSNPVDIGFDINFDQSTIDRITYKLDLGKLSSADPVYVDKVDDSPIQVENRKGEYPWTGGMGTLIFTVSGLILMSAAAYVYSRKRRASYDD